MDNCLGSNEWLHVWVWGKRKGMEGVAATGGIDGGTREDGNDEEQHEEEDGCGTREELSGNDWKIKDGGVKTFSFIAGEGVSQLARLSSTGHYSSFNRSVSDSQHKSLHPTVRACERASGCVCMGSHSMMPSAGQHKSESRWTEGGLPGWLACMRVCVCVFMRLCKRMHAHTHSCVVRAGQC